MTILVLHDDEGPSLRALDVAMERAAAASTKIHLCSLGAPPPYYEECLTAGPVRREDLAHILVGLAIARPALLRLAEAGRLSGSYVATGPLESAIIRCAAELGCERIVMGAHLARRLNLPVQPDGERRVGGLPVTAVD